MRNQKNLVDKVRDVVTNFITRGEGFSIFNITSELRKSDPSLKHFEVKSSFLEIRDEFDLCETILQNQRGDSYRYYEFTETLFSEDDADTNSDPTSSEVEPEKQDEPIFNLNKIINYVKGRQAQNNPATLKSINGTIKSKYVTIHDVENFCLQNRFVIRYVSPKYLSLVFYNG